MTNAAETANALKHLPDAELVSVARESEGTAGAAFGELVRRYQRIVYALAASLVRPSDAEDVVQETFLRAFRNLDLVADPGRFGVWLRRIAFGVSIDHVRADTSRVAVSLESNDPDVPSRDESLDPVAEDLSPLERLERSEVVRRVLAAIDRLPARYRVPLTLYHIDRLSHAKVARTLGVPESTVRSVVARAPQAHPRPRPRSRVSRHG